MHYHKVYDDNGFIWVRLHSYIMTLTLQWLYSNGLGSQWCCLCCHLQPDKVQYPSNAPAFALFPIGSLHHCVLSAWLLVAVRALLSFCGCRSSFPFLWQCHHKHPTHIMHCCAYARIIMLSRSKHILSYCFVEYAWMSNAGINASRTIRSYFRIRNGANVPEK